MMKGSQLVGEFYNKLHHFLLLRLFRISEEWISTSSDCISEMSFLKFNTAAWKVKNEMEILKPFNHIACAKGIFIKIAHKWFMGAHCKSIRFQIPEITSRRHSLLASAQSYKQEDIKTLWPLQPSILQHLNQGSTVTTSRITTRTIPTLLPGSHRQQWAETETRW
jgi:hypothetical protein